MSHPFTQDQVKQIYQALTSQDESFAIAMAKAAIDSAADIQCDMWADAAQGTQAPDKNDVRAMAEQYTIDGVNDFMMSLKSSLQSIEFELRLRLRHHTTFVGD